MFLTLFLSRKSLDILVGLDQGLADELCVWKGFLDIAHGLPVKFLLLLVFELQGRIDGHVRKYEHECVFPLVAIKIVIALKGFHTA